MTREQRTARLALRMAPTEFQMLCELAEVDGLTHSDVLRLAVRRVYAERFGDSTGARVAKPPRKGAK